MNKNKHKINHYCPIKNKSTKKSFQNPRGFVWTRGKTERPHETLLQLGSDFRDVLRRIGGRL